MNESEKKEARLEVVLTLAEQLLSAHTKALAEGKSHFQDICTHSALITDAVYAGDRQNWIVAAALAAAIKQYAVNQASGIHPMANLNADEHPYGFISEQEVVYGVLHTLIEQARQLYETSLQLQSLDQDADAIFIEIAPENPESEDEGEQVYNEYM